MDCIYKVDDQYVVPPNKYFPFGNTLSTKGVAIVTNLGVPVIREGDTLPATGTLVYVLGITTVPDGFYKVGEVVRGGEYLPPPGTIIYLIECPYLPDGLYKVIPTYSMPNDDYDPGIEVSRMDGCGLVPVLREPMIVNGKEVW